MTPAVLDLGWLLSSIPLDFTPEPTPSLCIATDTVGLIRCILSGLATTMVFGGAALSSKYDVVNESIAIECQLPFLLTWEDDKQEKVV